MLQLLSAISVAALRDRKGISAMEYGILAAALIGIIYAAVTALGTEISTMFGAVITDLKNVTGG
jgi:pilus assembly protein Flp/PilA